MTIASVCPTTRSGRREQGRVAVRSYRRSGHVVGLVAKLHLAGVHADA